MIVKRRVSQDLFTEGQKYALEQIEAIYKKRIQILENVTLKEIQPEKANYATIELEVLRIMAKEIENRKGEIK